MKNKFTYIIFFFKFTLLIKIDEMLQYGHHTNIYKEKKLIFINNNYSIYSIKTIQLKNLYIINETNKQGNYPNYYTADKLIIKKDILGLIKFKEKKILVTLINFNKEEETFFSYSKIEKPENKKITFYLIKSEKKKFILILKFFDFEKQKFVYKIYLMKSYKNKFGIFLINEFENSMDFYEFGIYKENGFFYLHMGNQIYIYYIQSFFGKYLFDFDNFKIFSPFIKDDIHIEKYLIKNNLLFIFTNFDLRIYYFKIVNNLENFKLIHKNFQNIVLNKKNFDNRKKLNFQNEDIIYDMQIDFFFDFCIITLKSDKDMKLFIAKNFKTKTKLLKKKYFYDLNFYSLFKKMDFSILNYLDKDEFLNLLTFDFQSQKNSIDNFSTNFSNNFSNNRSSEIKFSKIEINNLKIEALDVNFIIKKENSIFIKKKKFCPKGYKLKNDLFNYCEIDFLKNKEDTFKECKKINLSEKNMIFSELFFTCAKYKDFSTFEKKDIKKIKNFNMFKKIKKQISLRIKFCKSIKNIINCSLQTFCIYTKGKCKLNKNKEENNKKKEEILTNGFLEEEILIKKLKNLKLKKSENKCIFHIEERNKKLLINYNNSKNPSNSKNKLTYESFTFCKTEINFKNYKLSQIAINPELEYSFPNLNPKTKNEPILIFQKSWKTKIGEKKNFFYIYKLQNFLTSLKSKNFNLYSNKITIYIIFPNEIKFENHFAIKISNSSSNLLFNIFLFFFMLISISLIIYFLFIFWGYFYNVLYLRRFQISLLDYLQGKRVHINFEYYVKNGFIKVEKFAKGVSFFGEDQCSICRAEFVQGQGVLVLKCRHVFHKGCLRQWHKLSDSKKRHRCIICNENLD